jgi:hypothetical protein
MSFDENDPMAKAMGSARVVKKIAPRQHGAQRWARRYGDALVCVRYRVDATGERRYTTVELLVDEAPTLAARRAGEMVRVRISVLEKSLRLQVMQAGGRWDARAKVWHLRFGDAKALGLLDRIVTK